MADIACYSQTPGGAAGAAGRHHPIFFQFAMIPKMAIRYKEAGGTRIARHFGWRRRPLIGV